MQCSSTISNKYTIWRYTPCTVFTCKNAALLAILTKHQQDWKVGHKDFKCRKFISKYFPGCIWEMTVEVESAADPSCLLFAAWCLPRPLPLVKEQRQEVHWKVSCWVDEGINPHYLFALTALGMSLALLGFLFLEQSDEHFWHLGRCVCWYLKKQMQCWVKLQR